MNPFYWMKEAGKELIKQTGRLRTCKLFKMSSNNNMIVFFSYQCYFLFLWLWRKTWDFINWRLGYFHIHGLNRLHWKIVLNKNWCVYVERLWVSKVIIMFNLIQDAMLLFLHFRLHTLLNLYKNQMEGIRKLKNLHRLRWLLQV